MMASSAQPAACTRPTSRRSAPTRVLYRAGATPPRIATMRRGPISTPRQTPTGIPGQAGTGDSRMSKLLGTPTSYRGTSASVLASTSDCRPRHRPSLSDRLMPTLPLAGPGSPRRGVGRSRRSTAWPTGHWGRPGGPCLRGTGAGSLWRPRWQSCSARRRSRSPSSSYTVLVITLREPTGQAPPPGRLARPRPARRRPPSRAW
jgi:hypothetical protein